ncbi:sigma-70 family RNA polymerase sigma factor [Kitasatospora sp. NPDC052896]|uniref:sigma-70 family RNA polymerase sigma factor n=1 Tax=Kitasatospora sp. NPDC052896 TaxID=3364061 RepID=UPI0037C575CF
MRVDDGGGPETVIAARAGDAVAREQLVTAYLPLVYNVVGRAMNGHADVDDVVQDTMLRVVGGLEGLREPSSFRSWLVAIAMNEVRRRWSARQNSPVPALDELAEAADPGSDFVDLTILRLGLSGQRREVAEATRWLDERERDLLTLWWLEAAGELTRAELVAALGIPPQHAAVRVQRMKEQLEVGRLVVRALAADPPCAELSALTSAWDGRPAALWRKRMARHVRTCPTCSGHQRELVPVEGLLAGLALVPLPRHLTALAATAGRHAGPGSARGHRRTGGRRPLHLAGTLALTATVFGALHWLGGPTGGTGPARSSAAPPSTSATAAVPSPPPSPAPGSSAAPAAPASPSSTPEHTAPATRATGSAAPTGLEEQLVELINAQRAKAGCRPLRIDPRLHAAAQQHSADMAANGYFDHTDQQGGQPDSRISAAGYQWSAWGENLDRDTRSPGTVLSDWMDGAIHQRNLLDCRFTDAGVGTAAESAGLLWTLDLAAPG